MKTTGRFFLALMIAAAVVYAGGCVFDDDSDPSQASHSIRGRVVDTTNHGIEGVHIRITGIEAGEDTKSTLERTVITGMNGMFEAKGIPDGDYTVAPYRADFSFDPPEREARIRNNAVELEAFTGWYSSSGGGDRDGYLVSGVVLDPSSEPVEGVRVAISGAELNAATSTGEDGSYSFESVPPGSYTIAPGDEDYVFVPAYAIITVRAYPVTVDAFTATPSTIDDDPRDIPAGSHRWYPMGFNASWTREVTVHNTATGASQSGRETMTVSGVTELNGILYWQVRSTDGQSTEYTRVEGDTVYTSVGRYGGNVTAHDDTSGIAPVFRFDMPEGEEYAIAEKTVSDVGAYFYMTWTGYYDGTGDVDTIGGTFEECRKYVITYNAFASAGGSSSGETTVTTAWLAENVGLVRLEQVTKVNGEETRRRTGDIIGYSVP